MSESKTSWINATTNPSEAIIGLVSCLNCGNNAWIEVRKNGDQDYPMMMKNPLLDVPFNWEMSYGEPKSERRIKECDLFASFFNETQKDLTLNWTECVSTKEAAEEYQKNGNVIEGLVLASNGTVRCPVRIKDANAYRRDITKDNYKYDYWMIHWKPKPDISMLVLDENVSDVFVICYNDEPVNMKESLMRAAHFMTAYADML